jgi:hypothetical protein
LGKTEQPAKRIKVSKELLINQVRMKKTLLILLYFFFLLLALLPTATITRSYPPPELQILCTPQVNEDAMFEVTVKSGILSIDNVTVTFNGDTIQTNATGKATFRAPFVIPDANNTFSITASKEGYVSTNWSILILNIPQLFPTVPSPMIMENTTFIVTVLNDEGTPVENVTLMFEHNNYSTDRNGIVRLTTPAVKKTETSILSVKKQGYLSNTLSLQISPRPTRENILGIYLLLGICATIVIASTAFIIYRFLKGRQINRK